MRWSPGPISPNIEDRRFDRMSPEDALALQRLYAQAGQEDTPLPPWMQPQDVPTQEALVNRAAFKRAFGVE